MDDNKQTAEQVVEGLLNMDESTLDEILTKLTAAEAKLQPTSQKEQQVLVTHLIKFLIEKTIEADIAADNIPQICAGLVFRLC